MFRYIPFGDAALLLKAGDDIDIRLNEAVRKMLYMLDNENIHGVIDLTPSYNELLVSYDTSRITLQELLKAIHSLEGAVPQAVLPGPGLITIPVRYGGEWGPDLGIVAAENGLTAQEVIGIHCAAEYHVYMLGFTPGFCYLGGMDLRLATPRRENPRVHVPAGSVGIAGKQTGVYPVDSPGGWQIIGRTDVSLFDPGREPVFLVKPGDKLRFQVQDAVSQGKTPA